MRTTETQFATVRLPEYGTGRASSLRSSDGKTGPKRTPGQFQISRPTIREYLTLLSQIFLVEELPAWHSNRLKRMVKTPKLHMGDTGLLCGLLGFDADALWEDRRVEVDIVIECGRQVAGVEVKATSTVKSDDFSGLRKLRLASGTSFAAGVLLYDGDAVVAHSFAVVSIEEPPGREDHFSIAADALALEFRHDASRPWLFRHLLHGSIHALNKRCGST